MQNRESGFLGYFCQKKQRFFRFFLRSLLTLTYELTYFLDYFSMIKYFFRKTLYFQLFAPSTENPIKSILSTKKSTSSEML